MMLFWIGLTFGFMAGNAFALGLVALAIARRPADHAGGFQLGGYSAAWVGKPTVAEMEPKPVTIVGAPADGNFTVTWDDPSRVRWQCGRCQFEFNKKSGDAPKDCPNCRRSKKFAIVKKG